MNINLHTRHTEGFYTIDYASSYEQPYISAKHIFTISKLRNVKKLIIRAFLSHTKNKHAVLGIFF
jgi:hypothetical protein